MSDQNAVTITKSATKTIKAPNGTEIKREAKYILANPKLDDNEAISKLLGEHLYKFAMFGYETFAARKANNSLISLGADKDQKSLLRSFRAAVKTLVEHMDMKQEEAETVMLAKPKFAELQAIFDAFAKSGETSKVFDFSTFESLPLMKSMKPEGAEDEDEDEEEEETK